MSDDGWSEAAGALKKFLRRRGWKLYLRSWWCKPAAGRTVCGQELHSLYSAFEAEPVRTHADDGRHDYPRKAGWNYTQSIGDGPPPPSAA